MQDQTEAMVEIAGIDFNQSESLFVTGKVRGHPVVWETFSGKTMVQPLILVYIYICQKYILFLPDTPYSLCCFTYRLSDNETEAPQFTGHSSSMGGVRL